VTLFLIGIGYLLTILLTVAVFFLIGAAHYFLWGRAMVEDESPRNP
jgi:hypothetical protein